MPAKLKILILVAVALSALSSGSCSGLPNGPSLSNVTLNAVSLAPTVGNTALCCCHVVGSAVNGNSVSVDVSIEFAAYDGVHTDALSTIFYFVDSLAPNASTAIDAPGFVFPCSSIKKLTTDVKVKGIAFPPS